MSFVIWTLLACSKKTTSTKADLITNKPQHKLKLNPQEDLKLIKINLNQNKLTSYVVI